MKRTGFTRKPGAPFSSFRSAGKELQRTPMKKRARKKPTVAEGSKYLDACRGEPCFMRIVGVCWGDTESVVPAHRNEGKGMGLKVANDLTTPACYACHAEYDQGKRFTREQKRAMWNAAFEEWRPIRAAKMGEEMELTT